MRLGVVIVSFKGRAWLERSLGSCLQYAPGVPVYVVDNASRDGSADFVAERFLGVTLLRLLQNLGFAGGNNVGIKAALADGAEAVFLLNQDAELTEGCLSTLEQYLLAHPRVGAVQPAIFLPDGRVNSLGNVYHYLGFAESAGNGLDFETARQRLPWVRGEGEPPYLSGAAVLMRAEALKQVGLFDEALFLYHEDLELSLRVRAGGWQLALAPGGRVTHHQGATSKLQYYYMERNRLLVWGWIFGTPTLLILLPAFIVSELALLFTATIRGWLGVKLRAYAYFLKSSTWQLVSQRRTQWRKLSRVKDGYILSYASSRLLYRRAAEGGWLTQYVFNPFSTILWILLKPLIRW